MAVAKEVMAKEILKALAADPQRFITLLDTVGGLKVIFPELARLKGVAQPREHHSEGDAFRHTLMLFDHLPVKSSLRLVLAALFHDLGKAGTKSRNEQGKITFYGHDKVSVGRFSQIAKRLNLPAQLASDVTWLIEMHMFPHSGSVGEIKATKLERMFLQNEALGHDLLALADADARASIPEDGVLDLGNITILKNRIAELKKNYRHPSGQSIPALVTGEDLKQLGMRPGAQFKVVLEQVRDAQLEGQVTNKEEALSMIREKWNL
jgi:poly(A) polymerase